MLAARLKALLLEINANEALETAMIHSVSGLLKEGGISRSPPCYAPHHTTSIVALVGGGRKAQSGEISLVHNGVLFLDELPEFSREALETLRQPLETGGNLDYPGKRKYSLSVPVFIYRRRQSLQMQVFVSSRACL